MNPHPATTGYRQKPPYLVGLVCLIPLLGAIAGAILLLLGLFKYKDKWLTIIGAFGIIWTIAIYSALFFFGQYSSSARQAFVEISKMQMNMLVKDIEFYKLSHGQYPDNLQQLQKGTQPVPIVDPAQGFNMKEDAVYNYERVGDKYRLYSSGRDGIPGTKDDLFPEVTITDSSKIGLLPPR